MLKRSMDSLRQARQKIWGVWSCNRGSVAPLVGVALITLVGAVGVAVDIGRGQVAQSKLQSSLDSAGLAAGAVVGQALDELELKVEAEMYLDANFAGETIDATITDFDLVLSEDERVVTLDATATLPTTFMRIFGETSMEVSARSEITREIRGLEVALVLDVTGSMCNPCTKLDDLKVAANDLIDILYGDETTIDDLWIGIVPFAGAVNVGTSHSDWSSDYATRAAEDNFVGPAPNVSTRTTPNTPVNDWLFSSASGWYFSPHAWSGCFEERFATGDDVTDATPSASPFKVYFYPDMSGNSWVHDSNGNKQVNTSGSSDIWANRGCPRAEVTTLTNTKATLVAGINALSASWPNHFTHINVGAVWGWRMLSPEWRGLWGGAMDTNNLPLDYDEDLSDKAVVIMTDGRHTMTTYTAYGLLSAGNLGTTDASSSIIQTTLNAKLLSVCSSMKEAGIIVYTVLFATTDTTVKDMLSTCASEEDYFFDATTGADLQSAFQAIGDSLSNLRVSR